MQDKALIYDCTLRDGTQGENVSLSVGDKLRIAKRLDDFGVPFIEGGWPGSNPKDAEFFERARHMEWKTAKLAAFGSTRRWGSKVDRDANLAALLEADTPVVTLVGKSWDFHVREALGIELQQNLIIIRESVEFLKERGKEVVFDAEHFFDGHRANPGYAEAVLEAAHKAGADWLTLCDTNGGTLFSEVARVVDKLAARFPQLGIHTHNDCELGVANTLAAVESGARMVQGTFNGYGERTGNANLTSIIPILELKLGLATVGPEKLADLASVAHFISETANVTLPNNLPFVGRSSFAHKGGIHVSAVLKDSRTYEHISPEAVGNRRRVLVSDLSGKSSLIYKIREFSDIDPASLDLAPLLEKLKRLEYEGYQFEGAEASFHLLLHEFAGGGPDPFECRGFRIMLDQVGEGFLSEATVRVLVDGTEEHTAAEGNGPVHALDRAIKKALARFFPEVGKIRLTDYKVRVLDASSGTAAKVRVLVESTDGIETWTTVGVSHNVIEASWKAILDSHRHQLIFGNRRRPGDAQGLAGASPTA